jgi:uncharacterized protein (TIGR00645 family)
LSYGASTDVAFPEGAVRKIELIIEAIIFQSRWLLAPFYLLLAFCLLLLLFHFGVQVYEFVLRIPHATETDVILGILSLIDVVFTANLVLIVIMSGYENFVSRIDAGDHDRPDWMTKVDFGGLKQKLITSIVAISAIHLLRAFMNIEQYSNTKLAWLTGIHVVFLFSMLVVALADRLADSGKSPEHVAKAPAPNASQ